MMEELNPHPSLSLALLLSLQPWRAKQAGCARLLLLLLHTVTFLKRTSCTDRSSRIVLIQELGVPYRMHLSILVRLEGCHKRLQSLQSAELGFNCKLLVNDEDTILVRYPVAMFLSKIDHQ